MDELDSINDDIAASLESFTKRFADYSSHQFNEMRKCSFFDSIPDDWLNKLVKVSKIITFKEGQVMTKEGDVMTSFYVIMFGTASVSVKGKKVGNIFSGECLGEGAFFSKDIQKRLATVTADCEVIALEITKADMNEIDKETQMYVNKALLLAMFKKLQAANAKINTLTRENEQLLNAKSIAI